MAGYGITETHFEAAAAWGREGVRHVAQLNNGQGFVAFDGPAPIDTGTILYESPSSFWFPVPYKVKRVEPTGNYSLALFSAEAFRLLMDKVQEATLVAPDLVLAVTDQTAGAAWYARTLLWWDVRVPELMAV